MDFNIYDDENDQGSDPKQLIYPEVHLRSPITRGKLALICHIAGIYPGFALDDDTLINNYDVVSQQGTWKRSRHPMIQTAESLKQICLKQKITCFVDSYHVHRNLIFLNDRKLRADAESIWKMTKKVCNDLIPKLDECFATIKQDFGYPEPKNQIQWIQSRMSLRHSPYRNPLNTWYKIRLETRKRQTAESAQQRGRYKSTFILGEGLDCFFNAEFVVIHWKTTGVATILDLNMVLMYCDLVEGRWLADLVLNDEGSPASLKLAHDWILTTFDQNFAEIGKQNFQLIEMIEALVVGGIQMHDTHVPVRGQFWSVTFSDFIELWESLGLTWSSMLEEGFMRHFCDAKPDQTSELLSVFRLWGHPPIEAATAATKMRLYMNSNAVTTMKAVKKNQVAFRVALINGYVQNHSGAWPECEFHPIDHKSLIALRSAGRGITNDQIDELRAELESFTFAKTFEINLDEDYSIFLKDKAIAPDRKHWDCVFQWIGMRYKPEKFSGSRRLLSYFINDENFDPNAYIDYIESGEYLIDEDFNVSTSLKEREVKLDGRLFAKMTPKARGAQVIGEFLISKSILPLLHENGMVKSEREIMQHLIKMSARSLGVKTRDDEYYVLAGFLNTDIKKYCQSQRHETNALIARDLNNLFGLNELFFWQHRLLLQSNLYVADPYCPPQNEEWIDINELDDPIVVKNPAGGIEGLQQKLWSTCSISILKDVAREMDLRVLALVCGDNQCIAVTQRFHPSVSVSTARAEVMDLTRKYQIAVAQRLSDINQILKGTETIVSSDIIIFGKRIIKGGSYLPQGIKPITRMCLWAETTVEETRSACSNLGTVAAKCINQGLDPRMVLWVHTLRIVEQLLHGGRMTLNHGIDTLVRDGYFDSIDFIKIMALIPGALGGFNYMLFDRFWVRNTGDNLTGSFSDLKRMLEAGLFNQELAARIFHQRSGNGDWLQLALDPQSGNIQSTQSITTIIERVTAGSILMSARNPVLKGLFHKNYRQEDQEIAQLLLDNDHPNPRMAKSILDLMPTGERKRITGYVETTKTAIRSACRAGGLTHDLLQKLLYYDRDQFINLINVVLDESVIQTFPQVCSVTLARDFRTRNWYALLGGRLIEGIETPATTECFRGSFLRNDMACIQCLTGNHCYCWAQVRSGSSIDVTNQKVSVMRTPYVGSETSERSQLALFKIKNASRALRRGIRAAMLWTWYYGTGDESWDMALKIAQLRTNIDLETLKYLVPVSASANLNHRLHDGINQTSFFTGRDPRFGKHIRLSNDRLTDALVGVDDTNLIFQQAMLCSISVIEDVLKPVMMVTGTLTYHLHVIGGCCVRPQEFQISSIVPDLSNMNQWDALKENKLIYDPTPVLLDTSVLKDDKIIKDPKKYVEQLNSQELRALLGSLTGDYISKGMNAMERAKSATGFTDSANSIDATGLVSECAASNPRSLIESMASNLLLDSASDMYFQRIKGETGILVWWSAKLDVSSNSLWEPLKIVLSNNKVTRNWIKAGILQPCGSPNVYNSSSYECIKGWIIEALRVLLKDPLRILSHVGIHSDDVDVMKQRLDRRRRDFWMLATLIGNNGQSMLKLKDLPVHDLDRELKNQAHQMARREWKDLVDSPEFEKNSAGNLYYMTRITLSELRSRTEVEVSTIATDRNPDYKVMKSKDKSIILRMPRFNFQEFGLYSEMLRNNSNDKLSVERKREKMQESHDYRHYILRCIGLNTTAMYKLYYAMEEVSRSCTKKRGMFLAEGSGGLMSMAGLIWPELEMFFNSMKLGIETDQRSDDYYPSEVLALRSDVRDDIVKRTVIMDGGTPGSMDLSNESCLETINLIIPNNSIDLLVCDIESNEGTDQDLLWGNILHLIMTKSQDTITGFIKVNMKINNRWIWVLNWIRYLFREVSIVISPYTNAKQREIYIKFEILNREVKMPWDYERTKLMRKGIYPMSNGTILEMETDIWIEKAQSECHKRMEELLINTAEVNTVTATSFLLSELGFMDNREVITRMYYPWLQEQIDLNDLWKSVSSELNNSIKGAKLRAFGLTNEVRLRAEIGAAIRISTIQSILQRIDLRYVEAIKNPQIAEIDKSSWPFWIRKLTPEQRTAINKSTPKGCTLITHREWKSIYKIWTLSGLSFDVKPAVRTNVWEDDDDDWY